MILPVALSFLVAAAAPPPGLQVCLRQLQVDPCTAVGLHLEARVTAWGRNGEAELSWSVDGTVRETLEAELVDGLPSRHLVLFVPSASAHEIVLEARLGPLRASDRLVVAPPPCPSALAVETVAVEPGRWALVVVANHGPGASGSWGIRAEVAGALAYESVVDSLVSGGTYELQLGWDDLLSRAGEGKALIPLVVRLKAGPGDLLADQPDYRVLLPRR